MRRRLLEQTGQEPIGASRVPYDRTDPMVPAPTPQAGAPPGGGAGDPTSQLGQLAATQPLPAPGANAAGGLGGLYGGAGGAQAPGAPAGGADISSTDQLTGDQLAQMIDPEQAQVDEMDRLLSDPNTPQQVKDQITMQLDLAARRRFGGLGG